MPRFMLSRARDKAFCDSRYRLQCSFRNVKEYTERALIARRASGASSTLYHGATQSMAATGNQNITLLATLKVRYFPIIRKIPAGTGSILGGIKLS